METKKTTSTTNQTYTLKMASHDMELHKDGCRAISRSHKSKYNEWRHTFEGLRDWKSVLAAIYCWTDAIRMSHEECGNSYHKATIDLQYSVNVCNCAKNIGRKVYDGGAIDFVIDDKTDHDQILENVKHTLHD